MDWRKFLIALLELIIDLLNRGILKATPEHKKRLADMLVELKAEGKKADKSK